MFTAHSGPPPPALPCQGQPTSRSSKLWLDEGSGLGPNLTLEGAPQAYVVCHYPLHLDHPIPPASPRVHSSLASPWLLGLRENLQPEAPRPRCSSSADLGSGKAEAQEANRPSLGPSARNSQSGAKDRNCRLYLAVPPRPQRAKEPQASGYNPKGNMPQEGPTSG